MLACEMIRRWDGLPCKREQRWVCALFQTFCLVGAPHGRKKSVIWCKGATSCPQKKKRGLGFVNVVCYPAGAPHGRKKSVIWCTCATSCPEKKKSVGVCKCCLLFGR